MKINTNNLLKHLQNYIDGSVELSSGQLKAVELLLKKSLPDARPEEAHANKPSNFTITIKQQRD